MIFLLQRIIFGEFMSKAMRQDLRKLASMNDLFADNARLRAKQVLPSAPSRITPTCSFSNGTSLPWLADQNIKEWQTYFLQARGFEVLHVERLLDKAVDDLIFDYAITHGQRLITSDYDFSNFRKHEHIGSFGVLVVPNVGHKRGSAKERHHLAATHFMGKFANLMSSEKGIVASYAVDGTYEVHQAAPGLPGSRKMIAQGKYTHG